MFLEKFLEGLPGEPSFDRRLYRDKNPVSGQMKMRVLEIPNQSMRELHQRLIRWLRRLDVDLRYATGSIKGSSALANVRKHFGSEHFYAVDLRDAYHHVVGLRLAGVLCQLDERIAEQKEKVLAFLEHYCLSSLKDVKGLPIGFPASPDLFNIYLAVLLDCFIGDVIRYWWKRWGQKIIYTRYLDDLCISSPEVIGDRKRRTIREFVHQAGFEINHLKSGVYELSKGPVVITGIGLQRDSRGQYRTFVPREYTRKLQGILHLAKKDPPYWWHRVEGMMGVFKAASGKRLQHPNRTEQKILSSYYAFHRALSQARRKN